MQLHTMILIYLVSRVRRFDNDFHGWRSHVWKSLLNRFTSDKNVIHGNECIIVISYTLFYVVSRQFRWKQVSIADFAIVAKDGLFWPRMVASQFDLLRQAEVGYWHYDVIIRRLFLHAQIDAKAIFTSE